MTAKGKAPNLRNSAYLYRDEHPEIVWRSCCLVVEKEAELKKVFSAQEWERIRLEFLRGVRDPDFLHHCRSMDKNFSIQDLRFVQMASCETLVAVPASLDGLDQAQVAAMKAEFNLFWETLKVEQGVWPSFHCRSFLLNATLIDILNSLEAARKAK